MKSIRWSIGLTLLFIGIFMTACQTNQRTSTAVIESEIRTTKDSLVVKACSVHRVENEAGYPHGDSTYTQAWLVRIHMDPGSTYPAQHVDFAVGEYIIPEYGGWIDGIYFRIYEASLLDELNGQAIQYRLPGDAKLQPTDVRFQLPEDEVVPIEDENELLGRKM